MNFLYYLACIGYPNYEEKIQFLKHNLEYIYNNIKQPFDIILNIYETNTSNIEKLTTTIKQYAFIKNTYIHIKKGILTQVFLTNPHNKYINNYSYILFVLDDVKIQKLDINTMIKVKESYNLDIISPKVLNATHNYMYNYNTILKTNFLEVFILLMTPKNMQKFFSLHNTENKWMWGVDLLFSYFNVSVGINNQQVAKHMLPSNSKTHDALTNMNTYLHTHTSFKNIDEIYIKYAPIKYAPIKYAPIKYDPIKYVAITTKPHKKMNFI
jgi:hypothetical protein